MSIIQTDTTTQFKYELADVFNYIQMQSTYMVDSVLGRDEQFEKFKITYDNSLLFDKVLSKAVQDTFMHVSVLAKDIDDACRMEDIDVITPPDPNPSPATGGVVPVDTPRIIFEVIKQDNWNANLTRSFDSTLYQILVYYIMEAMYEVIVNQDLLLFVRSKLLKQIDELKTIINYRNIPPMRVYRAF